MKSFALVFILVVGACAVARADEASTGKPPVMHDPACPQIHGDISWLADAKDCHKYYQCVNGNKYEFVCPGDLHWNPKLEVCDFEWQAGCKAL